ncbi:MULTISPECIES: enoyl-CoA hydratase-related protein [unclassified Sphingomonas]|uniref:enoyl-CoA hydratase/isomerase family protein n=1 Tax=unclassified Sphingomonas TaxID=196159 RepID=UPI00092B3AD5|nr:MULTISPECIES: enoyl-CoA hydratase-related protein [unclassified Sphingomonas]OJU18888.1 MAG: hypothetical protein BGN95_01350 [Sphingomonas sp. 66-10]
MAGTVHMSRRGSGIALLEIENPPANAMNAAMLARMTEALAGVQSDDSVRAVVLTGRGKAFCSGADLKEAAREATKGSGEDLSAFARMLELVATSRVPTIAAINGACVGGGFELALCCDIRLASDDATFICAGVNVGLMASTYRLPRLIGLSRAKAMLLSGLPFTAAKVEQWGLVTELHAASDLLDGALRIARRIATRAPLSIEATKRTTDLSFDMSPEEARAAAAAELAILQASTDHREAITAFVEKREPKFERR